MAVKHLKTEEFVAAVDAAPLAMVDFWASWCGPCKMIAPEVEQVAMERDDIKVCKVNVDEEGELSIRYGVMSIPTLLIFQNGEVVTTAIGYRKKDEILDLLK